ncbi:MAG: universal stress protein [Planctomycetota bacterium]
MSEGAFQKILVPVEFETLDEGESVPGESVEVAGHDRVAIGPYTIRALELAARLARGGELWIVHVHHRFSDYATWMEPSVLDELNNAASQYSTEVLKDIAVRHCPDVKHHYVIEAGRPIRVILELAEKNSADAIVLAASSRGKVNRAFHGSTADRIIRRASCPVIVVPSGTP